MLGRLKIGHKLLLLVLPPLLIALGLSSWLLYNRYQLLQEYQRAQGTVSLAVEASALIHALQSERGLSNGYLNGQGALPVALREARDATDKALQGYRRVAQAQAEPALQDALQRNTQALSALLSQRSEVDARQVAPPVAFAAYTRSIDQMLALVSTLSSVSHDSALIRPGFLLLNLLELKENAGKERGFVNGLLSAGQFDAAAQQQAVALYARQSAYAKQMQVLAGPVELARLQVLDAAAPTRALAALRAQILATAPGQPLSVAPAQWFAVASSRIALLKAEQDQQLAALSAYVDSQLARSRELLWGNIAASSLIALALLLLLWRVYRGIHAPLARLERLIGQMSQDLDLSPRAAIAGEDEVARIGRAFDTLTEAFANALRAVKHNSQALQQASDAMRGVAERAAQAAQLQRDSSSQIAAAVEQMSEGIASVSENTQHSLRTADQMREEVEHERLRMDTTASAIGRTADALETTGGMVDTLRNRAQEINHIITAIREIADQTNLLALNAAIEAARAGESGRGFAVVADEVRKLAERTSRETVEITGLVNAIGSGTSELGAQMDRARADMHGGIALVAETVAGLGQIREQVAVSTGKSAETAEAMRQQSAASNEVAVNISRIASLAEDNAAIVQEAETLAQQLNAAARQLAVEVAHFRLSREG